VLESLCAATFLLWTASLGCRVTRALWMHRHLGAKMEARPTSTPQSLICLLPAYQEQSLVYDTLTAFAQATRDEPTISIVVITSLREERERDALLLGSASSCAPIPTTTEVVRATLAQTSPDRFHHIVYSGQEGGKAVHLNFALGELCASGRMQPSTYIGVYDFDSRPEPGSLSEVAMATASLPDAILQPVLPVLGADAAAAGGVTDAAIHVLRSLGTEVFVWWLWNRANRVRLLWRGLFDAYFVGSGLFIRADLLEAAGGFPSPVDDVPLGFAAAAKAWRVVPTRRACLTQCYPDLRAAIRSRTLVFHAYCDFLASTRREPRRLLTGTCREAFLWSSSPLVLVAATISLASMGNWITLGVSLVFVILTVCTAAAIGHHIARGFNRQFPRVRWSGLLLAPFYPFWRAISAWRCLVAIATSRGSVDFSGNKTPRIVPGERT